MSVSQLVDCVSIFGDGDGMEFIFITSLEFARIINYTPSSKILLLNTLF